MKKIITLCIVFLAVIIIVTVKAYRHQITDIEQSYALNAIQSNTDFPFTIKEETRISSGLGSMWMIIIILPKQYYSKDNLDRLFTLYSKKYPNKEEKMRIKVYTDKKNLEEEGKRTDGWSFPGTALPEDLKRLVYSDAVFYREGDGALAYGGRNEWYTYCPDLDKPEETKIIILKGTLRFREKKVLEAWETSNVPPKVRVTAYEIKDVEPSGIYYTFESPERDSDYWRIIMTFRQDDIIPIPRNQVRRVNDQVVYIFMGSMYAVNTNVGEDWLVWDAGRDLLNCENCSGHHIEEVKINQDGIGTMKLVSRSNSAIKKLELSTKDYGRHWSKDK